MKRKLLIFVMLLTLSMPGVNLYAEALSATADGFGGEVKVTLEVEDGVLLNVSAEGAGETPGIGEVALQKLPEKMVEANSVEVDTLAGATITSKALLEAAGKALADANVKLKAVEKAEEGATAAIQEPIYTDVLVIGGGGAGIAAGSAAAEAGAKVILVEKLPFLGGCTAMSGGVFTRAAVDSDEEGSMDADALYRFLMDTAENKANESLVKTYVDNSIDTFNWVYDNMVGSTEDTSRYAMVPESIVSIRMNGGSAKFFEYMADYAKKVGVDIHLETEATNLIYKDDKVVGAVVKLPDGSTQEIYAEGGVVLATGGFASSKEMLAEYSTRGADKIDSYASAGVVGDGIRMAEAVDAQIFFNDDWDTCGSFSLAFTGYNTRQMHYMVLLNNQGQRFIDEANIQPAVYTAMRHEIAKGNEDFWYVTDDVIESDTQWLLDNAGAFQVNSLEELADVTGMPLENLQITFADYEANKGLAGDSFGKSAEYNKGITAPYTVVPTLPKRTTTIGGLVINDQAEVLDAQAQAIPGLYAAGEVANASFYYVTYTCGTAVGHAIIFGRIAGTQAAQNAGK
ncbi:MAG: FAD-binding protein [Eubacteriales bacterium]|nr:FAD-binding protein [Eubacteriales bacterium]